MGKNYQKLGKNLKNDEIERNREKNLQKQCKNFRPLFQYIAQYLTKPLTIVYHLQFENSSINQSQTQIKMRER